MAHSDDATKAWVSAIPTKNAEGKVTEWRVKYKYTLAVGTGKGNIKSADGSYNDDFIHIFSKYSKIDTPLKAPTAYTKSELLELSDITYMNEAFNKKYAEHISTKPTLTVDKSFDVTGLSD
jgi:hypothetical protein|tara:strand:- start:601 stop:963 length:363 start_codon:yes stop_codon:yes gene_type:complete